MSYCKNRDCFGEESCKKQCRGCKSYDCCDDPDREVDVYLETDEKIDTKTVVIETIFKLKI